MDKTAAATILTTAVKAAEAAVAAAAAAAVAVGGVGVLFGYFCFCGYFLGFSWGVTFSMR